MWASDQRVDHGIARPLMDRVVRVYIVLSASCRVLLVSDFVVLITQYGDINYRYIVIYDSAIFRPALDNVTNILPI